VSTTKNLLAGRRKNLPFIAIIALLLVSPCLAQPTVTLSVSSGPPTTKLLVSGGGFDPFSEVDIFFDRKDPALAVTDETGAFGKIGITVPGSAKLMGSPWDPFRHSHAPKLASRWGAELKLRDCPDSSDLNLVLLLPPELEALGTKRQHGRRRGNRDIGVFIALLR